MLHRLLCFLAISIPVLAGTIDSGTIITLGSGDHATWLVDVSSTSGNYSVDFRSSAETWIGCVLCPIIRPGDRVNIYSSAGANLPPYLPGPVGQATIGGTFYPELIYNAWLLGISSSMSLSASFIAGEPGWYDVPFTMTGVLQAATVADLANFVLDDPVSGYGYASFYLGSGTLVPSIMSPIRWTFVPEPLTVGLVGFGLALILAARVRR